MSTWVSGQQIAGSEISELLYCSEVLDNTDFPLDYVHYLCR